MKHLFIFLSLSSFSTFSQIDEAIKFKITDPNGHTDETILRLKNESTSGWDDDWDAWKLFTPLNQN